MDKEMAKSTYNLYQDWLATPEGMDYDEQPFSDWLVKEFELDKVYHILDPYCGCKTKVLFESVTKCSNLKCKSLLYIFEREKTNIIYRVRNPEWWSHFENVVKKI